VTIHYSEDGKRKTIKEHLELPADLSNGIVTTLLADIDPKAPKTSLSMLVSTPEPRLVKLEITPSGEEPFRAGDRSTKAVRYVIHVDIGGIAGVIAPLIGKQPPPTYVWMIGGGAPGFLKSEGPLFQDGPIWQIELSSPEWPKGHRAPRK
jgi:hypothetical protein